MFGANCSDTSVKEVPSNAGIAGAGVLLAFVITASITLSLSAMLIFQEFRARKGAPLSASVIRRRLLQGYSDQQIISSVGIQAVGLSQIYALVPYHFFLVWMLSLISMATHNATLLALVHDFRRDWVLRWLRQGLIFANLILSCVYGVFVLQAKRVGLPATMPIMCAWQYSSPSTADVASAYVATILTVAGNCIVFALASWYLHSRAQRFFLATRVVGLALMIASAAGAAIRAFLLSQAFGNPDVKLSDEGEKTWGFGQVLGLLMLLLPLISSIEIYRGELAAPPPVVDDDDVPLVQGVRLGSKPVRVGFQPNPYWGSETTLFRR